MFEGLAQRVKRSNVLRGQEDGRNIGRFPGTVSVPANRSVYGLLDAFNTSPWLRGVVGRIATSSAAPPWMVVARQVNGKIKRDDQLQFMEFEYRQKYIRELKNANELYVANPHPALRLLNGGNTIFVGMSMRYLQQCYLEIVGEAFYILQRNAFRKPVSAWPVPPHWVQHFATNEEPWYHVRWAGIDEKIPAKEMLHMQMPNLSDPYGRGNGIACALTDEINIDEYSSKNMTAFFYNRARPDVIVSGENLTPRNTEQLERSWLERMQGFWKAYLPFFIPRKVDVQTLTQTFESMELSKLRDHQRDVMMQTYGLSPNMMGVTQNADRSALNASAYVFDRYQIVPRLEFWRQHFNRDLAPQYDDRIVFEYMNPCADDDVFNKEVMIGNPSAFSIDEHRALAKHPPLEDGTGKLFPVTNRIKIRSLRDDLRYPDPRTGKPPVVEPIRPPAPAKAA